jgi:hypothetical protein
MVLLIYGLPVPPPPASLQSIVYGTACVWLVAFVAPVLTKHYYIENMIMSIDIAQNTEFALPTDQLGCPSLARLHCSSTLAATVCSQNTTVCCTAACHTSLWPQWQGQPSQPKHPSNIALVRFGRTVASLGPG